MRLNFLTLKSYATTLNLVSTEFSSTFNIVGYSLKAVIFFVKFLHRQKWKVMRKTKYA